MTSPAAAPREAGPVRSMTVAAVVFLVVLLAVAGAHTYRDLQSAQERRGELEASIAVTEDRVRTLERRILRLKDDPLLLERMAREELGLVRPGDVVIVMPEGPAASAPAPSAPGDGDAGEVGDAGDAGAVDPVPTGPDSAPPSIPSP